MATAVTAPIIPALSFDHFTFHTDWKPARFFKIGQACDPRQTNPDEQRNVSRTSPVLRDPTTSIYYSEIAEGELRKNFLGLAFSVLFSHSIRLILKIAERAFHILTLYYFHKPDPSASFLAQVGTDLLKIFLSPVVFIGLELSALGGIVSPNNFRKIFTSWERIGYDKPLTFGPIVKIQMPSDGTSELNSSYTPVLERDLYNKYVGAKIIP